MNKLKIGLKSTWWDRPPHVRIHTNNDILFDDKVEQDKTLEFKFINFDSTTCQLCIELVGKTDDQTVVDLDNNIVKDQLIQVEKIEIDDIDLGILIFTKGIYYPEYPLHLQNQDLPLAMPSIDTFGFNGKWVLEFDLPFAIWYLENLP